MNYTHLGRTGLKVSRLCLGTMNFGDVTDEKTSARILDEALEAGINFIDTADVYGTEQVTAPLIGPRTVEQLQQALHATTVTLSDDTMSCLDEIWPGPGGEAPQAYAW